MKKEMKGIRFPTDLIEKIEKYQEKNYLTTFTAALIDIIKKFFGNEPKGK